jgi:DnaJ-class molecular chaperone
MLITEFQKIPPDSQVDQCHRCQGSGVIFDLHAAITGDEVCPRCAGSGNEFFMGLKP